MVGISDIKARRLRTAIVKCHPSTKVGDYVPFNFCPRSVMLFLLHKRNHEGLDYHEGQAPIIHLEADLREVVAWAESHRRLWAFSNVNASAYYATFFKDLSKLDEIDWLAVDATSWPDVKEKKQAEFLLHESFPLELVSRIGVYSPNIYREAYNTLETLRPRPVVEVKREWYY
jgi:hypothetical protein